MTRSSAASFKKAGEQVGAAAAIFAIATFLLVSLFPGAEFQSVQAAPETVNWTDLVGATANGGTLIKSPSSCDGCEATGKSSQQITSGEGYFEWTLPFGMTSSIAGLMSAGRTVSVNNINFAITFGDGYLSVYESGAYRMDTFGQATVVPGDVLRVAVVSGQVKYSRNGSVFYTSALTPTYPLVAAASLIGAGASLSNGIISAGGAPDTTPPVISGVASGSLTQNSATVSWTTNEPADTQVEYGTTTAYGSTTTLNAALVISHSQVVAGLTAGTLYHYRVRSKDATGNLSISGDFSFTTQAAGSDTTPPVISGIGGSNITSSSAVISWTTNEPADSQVEYGLTTGYGSSTPLNSTFTTSHSRLISGLQSSTLYHYRVRSRDVAGNLSVSTNRTFTTLAAVTGFQEVLVDTGADLSTAMAFAPDGRLFVAEKGGRLRVIQNGRYLNTPFHTFNVAGGGEQGLLGITFDPNFQSNQYVYVYYTATGPTRNRVSRLTANGNVSTPGSETVLLELPSTSSVAHQGGAIHFGPDGKLYVAVGDHQTPEVAQSLNNPFGKMLRINADGGIPTDNPFYNQTTGINRAIYALGLRNPFTFAVDAVSGRIFVNDVGYEQWEEINQLAAGANYGWPTCEGPQGTGTGSCNNPGFTYPIHAYNHAGGEGAVTGGAFYRGSQFPAEYYGDYFFGDYTRGWIRYLDSANQVPGVNNPSTFFRNAQLPVDLKVGPEGSLYYLYLYGDVYRIEHAGGNQNPTAVISADPTSGPPPLAVTFNGGGSSDPEQEALTYVWNFGDGSPNASGVNVTHTYQTPGAYTATLTVTDVRGGFDTETQVISVGNSPVATIVSPAGGSTYNGGATIFYQGTATDAEDGTLAAGRYSWRVVFHHAAHTHPFLGPITGVTGGSFQIPANDHTETDVWYRIHLTVTDSSGLQHEVTRDVFPNLVTLTLGSNIPGASLTLDGQPFTAPIVTQSVVGVLRGIGAPSPQTINGNQHNFVAWSDGGAATHTITTPNTNTTYTAMFQQVMQTTTNWFFPAAQSAVTASAGDNNGFEVSPGNLLADDGLFATDTNSGTNNNTGCTNNGKDKHLLLNFNLAPPPGTTTVTGIEVRLNGLVESTANSPKYCVQLSWNGGASWTSAKSTTTLSTTAQIYLLGSQTDLWGRTSWTTTQLNNTNFRVRIACVAGSTSRDFSLDSVAVRLTAQ